MTHPLRITVGLLLAGGWATFSPSAQAVTYTYPDLVQRLTDLDRLADVPPAGEKTILASSYDRNSQYDTAQDKYIRWDANGDGNGVVRMEGSEAVFADIQGPGCLGRIWAAKALAGHVKIYLDGGATPAVDLPFSAYFDGSTKPFTQPELVYDTAGKRAGGLNNFTPIPFQKSCKIVADPGWGNYYQIDYTSFPAGTVVPTFKMDLSAGDLAALTQANQVLNQRGQNPAAPRVGEKTEKIDFQAAPGATSPVRQLEGPQAITALRVKLDLPSDPEAARALLRQLAVQISWDGEKSPSVWCPLGDFFGYFGGDKPYQSLPVGLGTDGAFYSYWYMPFSTGAKIEVVNDGPAPVPMSWEVSHAPLTRAVAGLDRFHAKWHRDAFLPERKDRQPDWTLLTTQGNGRYVGTQLHVWNPRGGWWGEGDDKFFVDGEKFPSLFGTGSEDYFGAAWGLAPFDRAFHGLVGGGPSDGHWVVHRWHIVDSVPFQTSFEGVIEKCYSNLQPTLYDAVAFWYLDPKGIDPYPAIAAGDRLGYWPPPFVRHEPDALEGEDLPVLRVEPVNSTRQSDAASDHQPIGAVSGDKYLSWRALTLGQKLELGLHVEKAGTYRLTAAFLHRRSGGIFQIRLDGKPLGTPIDFYGLNAPGAPSLTVVDPVDLGNVQLTGGDHVLSAEYIGENPAADKIRNGDFYLDWVKLTAATSR